METDLPLPALAELADVWLATYDDGRVLLAGNRRLGQHGGNGQQGPGGKPERFVLALLSSVPFAEPARLGVDAVYEGYGHLVTRPKVSRRVISLMLRHLPPTAAGSLEVVGLTAADFVASWPALAADLGSP